MNGKLKEVLGFVSLKYKEPSACESCGEKFVCGATVRGCWCVGIEVSEQTRQTLKSKFRDCLCRNCLEHFASLKDENAFD